MHHSTTGRSLRACVLIAALGLTLACTPVYRNHGFIPPEEDLALVTVGEDTRDTVIAALGPPTSGGVLPGSDIYYVASRFRLFGAFAPEEISREVLAISFDAADRVTNIERFGLQDGNVIVLSRRVTSDNVRDTTFIRQLLGSIGRFDAGTVFGDN